MGDEEIETGTVRSSPGFEVAGWLRLLCNLGHPAPFRSHSAGLTVVQKRRNHRDKPGWRGAGGKSELGRRLRSCLLTVVGCQ